MANNNKHFKSWKQHRMESLGRFYKVIVIYNIEEQMTNKKCL